MTEKYLSTALYEHTNVKRIKTKSRSYFQNTAIVSFIFMNNLYSIFEENFLDSAMQSS